MKNNYNKNFKVDIKKMILFSIYSVIKKGENCTFERLVAECFYLFPNIFSFKRYPEWPDSLKLDRPLRTLRAEGLIVGNVKSFFKLTDFGEKVVKSFISQEILNIGKNSKLNSQGRSSDDKIIYQLKNSKVFINYLKNPSNFNITESDFRYFLRCTLETPERVIKQNLNYVKRLAEAYKEEELLKFLELLENKFIRGGKNG